MMHGLAALLYGPYSWRSIVITALVGAVVAEFGYAADEARSRDQAVASIQRYCADCHGPNEPEAGVQLDILQGDIRNEGPRWALVLEQVRSGKMPPADAPQPDALSRKGLVEWITGQLATHAQRKPNLGNLVPHELLFGATATSGPPASRLWRLSPAAYLEFVKNVHRVSMTSVVQPFNVGPERGIKDFAALSHIDEPSTEVLVRNATAIVRAQCAHEIVDGKVIGQRESTGEYVELMNPALKPTPEQLEKVIQKQFQLAVFRRAEPEEVQRLLKLYDKCVEQNDDRPSAVRTVLTAVLLRTDAMFHYEVGSPATQQLKPREVAEAVSFALMTKREHGIYGAADRGELITREQITAQVKRILDDPRNDKPRILGFFREYFEYPHAHDVFKDEPQDILYRTGQLVSDTDRLVQHILAHDRDVLKELLTTQKSFVNARIGKNKETRLDEWQRGETAEAKGRAPLDSFYGFDESTWPKVQPATLPPETRLGILMQPSWLIAWSGNFDNDIVRRGRFIRERLLGGTVPDLPIGVAAQVPDDPHRTLRDRMQLTRDEACWKCHQRMDDLGTPFEQFDHYSRFRKVETVQDREATAAHVDKQGKPLGPVMRDVALDTSGIITGTGDPQLDGPVSNPRELVRKLAASDRVRQVFIRHVFRYFLGRNESLADAKSLQEADRAYVASGGSFKALLLSLLTSDSFLHRATPMKAPE